MESYHFRERGFLLLKHSLGHVFHVQFFLTTYKHGGLSNIFAALVFNGGVSSWGLWGGLFGKKLVGIPYCQTLLSLCFLKSTCKSE